jgi:hypothetical protein
MKGQDDEAGGIEDGAPKPDAAKSCGLAAIVRGASVAVQ